MKIIKNIISASVSLILLLSLINLSTIYSQQPKFSSNKELKIYILTDLEGVSGVVTFQNHSYSTGKYYEQSKILLTKEINAALEGLLEEGVSEIRILDGHGSGGINIDYIHPEAQVILGRYPGGLFTLDSSFDALVIIGQHAMSNAPNGNLAHSFSSRTINNIWLNGKLIGEIGAMVLYASHFNVPTIFLSGDDVACNEIKEIIPNIETAAVKEGLGLNVALNLSPEKARRKIKEGIKKAVRKINKMELYKVDPPYEVVIEYKNPESAERKAKSRGWKRIDSLKCVYRTDDYFSIRW